MADIAGKWEITISVPMQKVRNLLEIIVDGSVLTGTLTDPPTGKVSELTNGKVDGDSFCFESKVGSPFGALDIVMSLKLNADGTIAGTSKTRMGTFKVKGSRE